MKPIKPLYIFEVLIGVFLVLIVVSLLNIFYFNPSEPRTEGVTGLTIINQESITNDLSLEGYTQADIVVSPGLVQLGNGCRAIVMNTGPEKSYAIKKAIDGDVEYRPLTHDTINSILTSYNIEVLMVKITDLKDELYFANLFLNKDNKIVNLDTRPTDAISIAVKAGKPVYIKDSILDKGQKIC